jgi:hypothetical protein
MNRTMFSILTPSRGRPDNIRRLYRSLVDTTVGDWELLVRLDEDDPVRTEYDQPPHQANITAPRILMAKLWNDLVPYAQGDILMMAGDDVTFNTEGWDVLVRAAFPEDRIGLVHGNDLSPNSATIGTHPFVTRGWVEALGYLTPPYFSSDYVDLWLTEVADALGRRVYLPEVIIEHHHPAFDKAEWDQTHQERVERHEADDMEKVWADTAPKRAEDAQKLRMAMT